MLICAWYIIRFPQNGNHDDKDHIGGVPAETGAGTRRHSANTRSMNKNTQYKKIHIIKIPECRYFPSSGAFSNNNQTHESKL